MTITIKLERKKYIEIRTLKVLEKLIRKNVN